MHLIFICLYFEKHTDSILALIKYGSNIRDMSKNFGFSIAKSYDEVFRTVRKMMNFSWAVINDDLWRTSYYQHFKPNQHQSTAQQKTKTCSQ